MYSRHGSSFSGDLHLTEIWLDQRWNNLETQQVLFSIRGQDEAIGNNKKFTIIEGQRDFVDEGTGKPIPEKSELFVASIVIDRSLGATSIGRWLGREQSEPTSGHLLIRFGNQGVPTALYLEQLILEWEEKLQSWFKRVILPPRP